MASYELYMAAAVAILSIYLIVSRKSGLSSLPLPPGPPKLPLIGNVHQAPKSHAWIQYYEWSKTYGPIMHLNMAGQSVIVLNSSKTAFDLLAKRGATFSDRPRFVVAGELAMQGMQILLRSYDQWFKRHQKLEAVVLNEKVSRSYRPFQDLESKQLLADLLKDSDDAGQRPIDCHDHIERTTASNIYSLFYGRRVQKATDPLIVQAHALNLEFSQFVQVGKYLVDSFPVLNKLPEFLAPWKTEAGLHWKREEALHVGNLERALGSGGWNAAKQMQQAVDAMEDYKMPRVELALDVGILVDAALDTSTETMMWFVVACITEGGSWMAQAQRELDTVVGHSRLPNFDDQAQLPYVNAVLDEVLRWRPVAPMAAPHFTKVESSYEGYRIPANSVVIANLWGIAREEAVFAADVESFVPERWLGADHPHPSFGYGRRLCPGRHIARNGLWISIARLLWAFDISAGLTETGEPVPLDLKGGNGLVNKTSSFKARFVPRGDWARKIITNECDTWRVDYHALLDQLSSGFSR